jgi:undecaprenyl pyrophosphate synthase
MNESKDPFAELNEAYRELEEVVKTLGENYQRSVQETLETYNQIARDLNKFIDKSKFSKNEIKKFQIIAPEVPEPEYQRELPPAEEHDEENRPQSESEAYHIAH